MAFFPEHDETIPPPQSVRGVSRGGSLQLGEPLTSGCEGQCCAEVTRSQSLPLQRQKSQPKRWALSNPLSSPETSPPSKP